MVFASLTFLYLFLPANLVLGYVLPRRHQDLLLVVFSLLFYAWGEPIWVSLLLVSSTTDYCLGRLIGRLGGRLGGRAALAALVVSVVTNLGLLATFKYSGFIVEIATTLTGISFQRPSFALPIGISFYTFQTLSYTIDVYRGEVRPQRSYLRFLMFVSLYHQLVAGPIVRYVDVAREIDHRVVRAADVARGATRLCVGLFKKVCFANVAGELVGRYLEADPAGLSIAAGWAGLLFFTLQIYFDFSGYSDMAIGLGLMSGFHYRENFEHPYVARTASEFWRRWHISLGSFFRDYVYIPLGGNRRRVLRNLMVVWGLTGLWHGASWNFILWGLYFGLLISLERLFLRRLLAGLPRIAGHLYLLAAVVVGWALFYFTDLAQLWGFLALVFGQRGAPLWSPELGDVLRQHALWIGLALLACAPVRAAIEQRWAARTAGLPGARWINAGFRWTSNLGMLLISTAMLVADTYNPFLYFRF